MYLVECLPARSSSAVLPESVSSRLMERNFFKGILKREEEEIQEPGSTHIQFLFQKRTESNYRTSAKEIYSEDFICKAQTQLVAPQIRSDPHILSLSAQQYPSECCTTLFCIIQQGLRAENTQLYKFKKQTQHYNLNIKEGLIPGCCIRRH